MVHDSRFQPPTPLENAIERNRRRTAKRIKYRAMCVRLIRNVFEYQDAGKEAKFRHVLERCRKIVKTCH